MQLLSLISGGAVLVALMSLVVAFKAHKEAKQTMNHLEAMIEQVLKDEFEESSFDESQLSRLEAKLATFLSSSNLAQKNITIKHEQIKTLVADISHQTKTPIANLLLYSELLKEKDLPEECEALVNQMTLQSEKLDFLIRSLVKMSRLENGIIAVVPKPNDLVPLIEKVVKGIAVKAEDKQLQITIIAERQTHIASFDPKWTEEAFTNILDNAVKYTPSGGIVTLRVKEYEMFCQVDFIDTGIGIAEEEQAKIFTRFYRSPFVADKEGVGIGLYLTRQIILAQGGYMKVISEVGKGSSFSVFLPRAIE